MKLLVNIVAIIFIGSLSVVTAGQNLISSASNAFNGNRTVQPIHLAGTAQLISGTDKTIVPVTIDAKSDGSAQISYSLPSGTSTTRWESIASGRNCSRSDGSQKTAISQSECWLSVPWFCPQSIFSKDRDPRITLMPGSPNSAPRNLIAAISFPDDPITVSKEMAIWSTAMISLDSSFLPATLTYSQQANDGSFKFAAILVRYSEYRTVNGVTLPYRIDRFVNGTLQTSLSFDTPQP